MSRSLPGCLASATSHRLFRETGPPETCELLPLTRVVIIERDGASHIIKCLLHCLFFNRIPGGVNRDAVHQGGEEERHPGAEAGTSWGSVSKPFIQQPESLQPGCPQTSRTLSSSLGNPF